MSFPFGDPCVRCSARSDALDPCDRDCDCVACPVCGVPTGYICGHCGGSLGCRLHDITIEEHVGVEGSVDDSRRCPKYPDVRGAG